MKYVIMIMVLHLSTTSQARPLELEEFSFQQAKLGEKSRDPLAPEYTGYWKYRTQADFRIGILGAGYWDNKVHAEAAEGAIRTVGWHWVAGLRITSQMDLFWEHHSRHTLDTKSPTSDEYRYPDRNNFPVEDSYGLRFNIYTGTKGKALWD